MSSSREISIINGEASIERMNADHDSQYRFVGKLLEILFEISRELLMNDY